jgi:hypothetical protein
MCECEKKYEKARIEDGLNPHVRRSIFLWAITGVPAFLFLLACLVAVPELSPGDPDVMTRWLNERTIRCIFGFLCIGMFTMFLEVKCNGNLLGQILQSPMACAVFMSAVFMGTVGLLVYM